MAAPTSFWQRIGSMFRGSHGMNGGSMAIVADPPKSGTEPARTSGFMRLTGREAGAAKLQDGYERLVALVDTMKAHFEKHDRRVEQLSGSLERIASMLEKLPESQRTTGECMNTIALHLDNANRASVELKETLAKVPPSIQAQADAIRSVSKQMERASESDVRLVGSLEKISQVVESLSAAGSAQVEALQRIKAENAEQRSALTTLLGEQGRRFAIVMITFGVLGAVAVGAAAYALWFVIQQRAH
ncbi:MAG: hypothetical protein CHACPFDD_03219 [Phycisphaerae bacterium]|nr:hypothetical protein [Phycisphaerae bacterium]